jgi:hypothetical protein
LLKIKVKLPTSDDIAHGNRSFGLTFGLLFQCSKGKAIPLQVWRGPEGSRRLRLPDLKTLNRYAIDYYIQ